MNHLDYLDRLDKLRPLNKVDRLKLVYQWTKVGVISFREFRLLITWIDEN